MFSRLLLAVGCFVSVFASTTAHAQTTHHAAEFFALPSGAVALLAPDDATPPLARPTDLRRAFAPRPVERASQQPSTNHARAVQAFQHGVQLADQLQWSDAADSFQEAYRLEPLPSTLRNLGLAHRALGRYTLAIDEMQRFLNEANPPSDVRSQAQDLITQMRGELATITVVPSVSGAALTLDGRAIHANEDIQVDPGNNHVLTATASGFVRAAQTFAITRTEHRRIDVRLEHAGGGIFAQWWLWTIVGAVVVGGVVAGVVLLSHEAPPDCGTLMVCITPH